jgi:hypothetical protein
MEGTYCHARERISRSSQKIAKSLRISTDVDQAMHEIGSQEARRRLGPDRDAVPAQSRELLAPGVCEMGMRSTSEFGSVSVDRMTYTSAGR